MCVNTAQSVRPRKLQLKTNQSKTKYAISYENDLQYLARSDEDITEYTTLIAESDTIFKGYEYDWKFILNRWIECHKVATGFKTRAGSTFVYFENFSLETKKKSSSARRESKTSFYVTTLDGKKYSVKKKSYIKCHFCKLIFETNNRRKAHEKAWHSKS